MKLDAEAPVAVGEYVVFTLTYKEEPEEEQPPEASLLEALTGPAKKPRKFRTIVIDVGPDVPDKNSPPKGAHVIATEAVPIAYGGQSYAITHYSNIAAVLPEGAWLND